MIRGSFYIIVLLALVFLLESCAIHAGFPFICFKKDCIKAAWSGSRKDAGGKRGLKTQTKIILSKFRSKQRRNKKKKLVLKKPPYLRSYIDTLSNGADTINEYVKILFLPKETQKDSVFLKTNIYRLGKEDKLIINYFLGNIKVKDIDQILIYGIIDNELKSDHNSKSALKRKLKRIEGYVIKYGVKEKKVKIVFDR